MRVVGVIAEYNPLHLGHAHHLAEARRLANADAVVVVMSSAFTQRGDAAILSPADRAKMALSAGADAVFALPAAWAVRDAEHFALGGVSIPGFILLIFVMLVGHGLNIAINLLGSFVHACRLQYLEFFSKFYEDGGVPFDPALPSDKFSTAEEEPAEEADPAEAR